MLRPVYICLEGTVKMAACSEWRRGTNNSNARGGAYPSPGRLVQHSAAGEGVGASAAVSELPVPNGRLRSQRMALVGRASVLVTVPLSSVFLFVRNKSKIVFFSKRIGRLS